MNVHHLAALLVRIAGILLLLHGVEIAIGLIGVGAAQGVMAPSAWLFLTFAVMWLTAAVLMLLYPTRVAGAFLPRAPADAQDADAIPSDAMTRLVLVAAGLFFLIDGIKDLASVAAYWAIYTAQGAGAGLAPVSFWTPTVIQPAATGSVALAAGLWLLLRPAGIAAFIHRLRR